MRCEGSDLAKRSENDSRIGDWLTIEEHCGRLRHSSKQILARPILEQVIRQETRTDQRKEAQGERDSENRLAVKFRWKRRRLSWIQVRLIEPCTTEEQDGEEDRRTAPALPARPALPAYPALRLRVLRG